MIFFINQALHSDLFRTSCAPNTPLSRMISTKKPSSVLRKISQLYLKSQLLCTLIRYIAVKFDFGQADAPYGKYCAVGAVLRSVDVIVIIKTIIKTSILASFAY